MRGRHPPELLLEGGRGHCLEGEVIERIRHAEPAIDSRVVVGRDAGHPPRFHEGEKLIAAGVEEDVADLAPFLDLEDDAAERLELQDVLVEVARAVEIQRREADVREALVRHGVRPPQEILVRGCVEPDAQCTTDRTADETPGNG